MGIPDRREFEEDSVTTQLVRKGVQGLALVAILAVAGAGAPVHAAAVGATDVDINIPDIVILHYFSSVDVSITSSALGTFLAGTAGDSSVDEGTAAPAAGGFSQDLAISPSALSGDPSAALLVLQNAWAVRAVSLAGGTNTQVSIANTDDTLDHATTSATITVSSVAVDDGTSNGATISFAAPGLSSPVIGDVELTLDLTNATNAGDYEDAVYTITAQNL
jgi:hypothetical protein